jgi:hypothetical protein
MGQFKPMVKMYTDEPSVILKLKKGGKVHHKAHKEHEEHGHKPMHKAMGSAVNMPAEMGMAPMRPSMMARRKAMNPMMYKKGGNVEAELHKVEKELKHHEHEKASKAHHGLKHGGKVHHKSGHPEGSMEHHKAMCKHYEKMCKEGGSAHAHKMLKHHKAMCMGGKYAEGGAIDKAETRTTIEGNAKKFAKTKVVDGSKHDKHHGTGEIKEGKPAGYKHGGHAHKMHHKSTGGDIPADTHEKKNVGKVKMHGTIEGNEHDYLNTEMHSAKRDKAHGTGGIKESNAGGFKHGGKAHHKMHHKATGGAIPAATEKGLREGRMKHKTVEGGNWENRAADTAMPGVKNRKTGEVHESNAGGYKHGGHAAKKHFATGGNVVDDGKAVKMPRHFVSRPVANSLQSGTFKRGGKVKKFVDGGSNTGDAVIDREDRRMNAERNAEKAENEAMRNTILGAPKKLYEGVKNLFSSSQPPAGSVTKTEKSVTVAPRKRGGRA